MGLKGSETGAKAQFQEFFPSAFMACPRLEDVREIVSVDRSETLAVLDGNVMVKAVPQAMTTFNEYVQIMVSQIGPAVEAAAHVVVVFDEPQAMTRAKLDEQRRRDARSKAQTPMCSEDLVACIKTDEFDEAMLHLAGCNVRLLQDHRAARPRFYDALCLAVMTHFVENTQGDEWSLTFDGVDARGAGRAYDAPRVAGVLSSDAAFWAPLLTREVAIGEGDIKLTDVAQRVHDAAMQPGSAVEGVVLNLLVTVDTDSLVIELLKQQTRLARPAHDRNELTVLCLREPARKRKGDDFITPTRFLCCNAARFYNDVAEYLAPAPARSEDRNAAVALLVAACACCGCDFLAVTGARADLMIPVVKQLVSKKPEVLKEMAHVFEEAEDDVRKAKSAIDAVLTAYALDISTKPRMGRSHASVSKYAEVQTLKAVWIVAYWCGREFRDCTAFGFCSESVA